MSGELYGVAWEALGARLALVEPTTDELGVHAPALAAFYNEPHNRALLTNEHEFSAADVVEQYAVMRREGARLFLLFADDELVGDCDLRHIEAESAEYAILVGARARQAKGFGTRFGAMLMALAFGPLERSRVFASVRPENEGSLRMLDKLGFVVDSSDVARAFAEEDDDVCLSLDPGAFAYAGEAAAMRIARRSVQGNASTPLVPGELS